MAALEPSLWKEFAVRLDRSLGGTATSLHGVGAQFGHMISNTAGDVDADTISKFINYYQTINPLSAFAMRATTGSPQRFAAHIADDLIIKSEFYSDFLRPNGDLLGGGGLKSKPFGSRSLVVSVTAPRRHRDMAEERTISLLRYLEPHISHAFHVSETLAAMNARSVFAMGRNDYIDSPLGGSIITDCNRLVAWADDNIFNTKLSICKISLKGHLVFLDEYIEAWAQKISKNFNQGAIKNFPLEIKSSAPNGWTVRAISGVIAFKTSPIFPAAFRGNNWPERQIAFILTASGNRCERERALMEKFGLSLAEASVAVSIAKGRTTTEIARARSTSIHTVRNQIRAVLEKMDIHHRGGIAGLVSSLPPY